jgi:tetratricopeptide (TPR) repeat protein
LILLGSKRPIRFSLPRIRGLFEDRLIQKSLSLGYVRYPFDLLTWLSLDNEAAEAFSRGVPLNTDDNMNLELAAPRSLYRDRIDAICEAMDNHSARLVDLLSGYDSEAEVEYELAASWFTSGNKDRALEHCRSSLALESTFDGQKLLGQILQSLNRFDEAREALELALDLGGNEEGRRFVRALLRSIESTLGS